MGGNGRGGVGKDRDGRGGEGIREGKEGDGAGRAEALRHFSFYNLTTALIDMFVLVLCVYYISLTVYAIQHHIMM